MAEYRENTVGTEVLTSNASNPYAHSFGNMESKITYVDPYNDFDYRTHLKSKLLDGMDAELKAQTVAGMGTGTAGSSLIPVYVDQRIVDRSRKFTPWTELIPRVTNLGTTADFNVLTSKGSAVAAAEDAALSDVTDTESRSSTAIKYLYSVGRVTGQVQSAMPPYLLDGGNVQGNGTTSATFNSPSAPNAKQYEVLKRARALRELEENFLWTGDASTTSTEFSGIVKLQGTTNQTDKSSSALTYDDLETIAKDAFDDSGHPNIGGCDSSTLGDIRKIFRDYLRVRPGDTSTTVGFGIPAALSIETLAGSVPVLPSQYLTNTTGAKQLFFLDTEYIEMRVLLDMTFETLAKTNDSEKFMLKEYIAPIMRAPQFNAFVDNIS